MPDIRKILSPNHDEREITVEFLVLHYTAVDLERTVKIFMNPKSSVSAHLVIDLDGSVTEMVDCLDGRAFRAWHAGESHWHYWSQFNDFAIGIELVNLNGNLFDFTDAQYQSLQYVVARLKQHYPALNDPERVVGHEHIAGHRGKADPGLCFDWYRFYSGCYPDHPVPVREPLFPRVLQQSLLQLAKNEPEDDQEKHDFWVAVSKLAETTLGLILEKKG